MPTDCISLQESGYFSSLINDYLNQKPELASLYNHFPKIEHFKHQISEKDANFDGIFNNKRQNLVDALQKQYQGFEISELTKDNISLLADAKTFTITTGHQLNLFTGPLYFLYKIVSTINLCKQLKQEYPENNFVPIYWMATEDHDFEEINYFNFNNNKISWKKDSKGPVGRLSTKDLDLVFAEFDKILNDTENASFLKKLFKDSYLNQSNLADATRFLANALFGSNGLVILDGDDADFKKTFVPFIKDELVNRKSFQNVSETNIQLADYTIQVNPREINLFYIEDNLRERIVFEDNKFKINNTKIEFSEAEILQLVDTNPEKFSPNVILRPLYQEVILPNLCYIGGGGEIAYWLQLKSNFEYHNVTFPILLIRNSAVLATEKQDLKRSKLNLTWMNLFEKQLDLLTRKTKEFSNFKIDFTTQKEHLKKQFDNLNEITLKTDKSFIGAVKAQEKKQIKGLENLEKRLLLAEKRVHKEELDRIVYIQNQLFPKHSLQERQTNFSEYYKEYGLEFIDKLFLELKPLEHEFKIIIL